MSNNTIQIKDKKKIRLKAKGGYAYSELGRSCEICHKQTQDLNQHICPSCADKIRKVIGIELTEEKQEPLDGCSNCIHTDSMIYSNKFKCVLDNKLHAKFDKCDKWGKL